MPETIKQEEINQIAWKACDTFRGTLDPTQYKDYILVMLFLKYMSDLHAETIEKLEKKYKGNQKRVERALARERFIMPKGSTFAELYKSRRAPNIGELINIALEKIEDANRSKLENIFRNIDFNSEPNLGSTKERNRRLVSLLEDFNNPKLDLRPGRVGNLDVIGNTYEYLISHFASDAGKKGGEFYTPPEVATLLAKLLAPNSGNTICDPTCGSGSLLIKVAREVEDSNFQLYGQESNGATSALCRMNMFLHGMDSARIERCNTLTDPALVEDGALMKFDIVVANPPFSLDKWGAENAEADTFNRFHRGVPPKSKADYAFISHMIQTTAPDGRVGVIVPHGVLFRGGAEGKIRKQFVDENLLKAVIGLPAGLFFGTGIPAAILIFDRNKKRNKDVLFIDASREFEAGKNQNKLRDIDIKKIVSTFSKLKTKEKYSYRAKPDEIAENDYNLNIPRYVDTFEEEEEVDIAATQKEIAELEAELKKTQKKMAKYMKELGV